MNLNYNPCKIKFSSSSSNSLSSCNCDDQTDGPICTASTDAQTGQRNQSFYLVCGWQLYFLPPLSAGPDASPRMIFCLFSPCIVLCLSVRLSVCLSIVSLCVCVCLSVCLSLFCPCTVLSLSLFCACTILSLCLRLSLSPFHCVGFNVHRNRIWFTD